MVDEYDERLAERFGDLERVGAPDAWSLVQQERDAAVIPRRHGRRRLVLAAAAIALALGVASLGSFGDQGQETLVVAGQDSDDAPSPSSTPSTAAVAPLADECTSEDLAMRLGNGRPVIDHVASRSPADLLARTTGVVWGSIVQIDTEPGGSTILLRRFDARGDGTRITEIRTPATTPDTSVRGMFVAFVRPTSDGQDPDGTQGTQAWLPDIEGLWIACDNDSPASPVLASPVGAAWRDFLDGGVTLNDLWNVALFPDGERTTELTSDVTEDGSTIFDLEMQTGDRLRLVVPTDRVGDGLQMIERPAPEPIMILGQDLTIAIGFPDCDGSFDLLDLGATRVFADPGYAVSMCLDIPDLADWDHDEDDSWNLRVVRVGRRYGAEQAKLWPYDPTCSACPPTGPVSFGDDGDEAVVQLVGTRSGHAVTAVSAESLRTLWTSVFVHPLRLHGGIDEVLVDVFDGPLVALDPQTGSERWRIERDEGERDVALSRHSEDGPLLLRSSFSSADNLPPVLRSVDIATGELEWEALGGAGNQWTESRPEIFADLVLMLEESTVTGESWVWAFSLDTGEPAWMRPVFGAGDVVQGNTVVKPEFETGFGYFVLTATGEVVRIDPLTGDIIFRRSIGAASFSGTDYAGGDTLALALNTDAGLLLVDPETGATASTELPVGCTALVGNDPWITLFGGRAPGCVLVADFQRARVFNKGFEPTTVSWVDRDRELGVDDYFDTEPLGDVLVAGRNQFESEPFPIDDIWLMEPELSVTAALDFDGENFGPIAVGMTLADASLALGHPIVLADLFSGCQAAVVPGDPYTPIFVVRRNADAWVIEQIIEFGPNQPDLELPC